MGSEKTAVVLFELKTWLDNSSFKAHFPVEVRFVKGDDLLLSPAQGRDSCYINIVAYRYQRRTKVCNVSRVITLLLHLYNMSYPVSKVHVHEGGCLFLLSVSFKSKLENKFG